MSAPDPPLMDLALTDQQWKALGKLADALDLFEPLAKRPGVGPKTVARLMDVGLVESGDPGATWRQRGYTLGYRLTSLGFDAHENERNLGSGRRMTR